MNLFSSAWYGFFIASFLATLTACMTDDSYTQNSTLHLTSQSDTLDFDTVLSGEISSTRTLWLYNKNADHLRVVKASLGQGKHSPFTINIDGLSLNEGVLNEEVAIHSGDSIRLFARISPPDATSDTIRFISDKLYLFLENGQTFILPLQAYAQDVYTIDSLVIQTDTSLAAMRPIRVMKGITIEEGHTLTLSPGTRLYMHSGASINVYGTLLAEGTLTDPIQIRGDRTDWMFDKQPYARIPGQWGGITFKTSSFNNRLNHCEITSGYFGIVCDSSALTAEKLRVENSLIHNMVGNAFTLRHIRAFVGNSQITNAGGDCINIAGGSYDFIHCTIGNFYSFAGTRGLAFTFTNTQSTTPLPLIALNVVNSIITGYSADELMGSRSLDASVPFEYTFHASLINTKGAESDIRFTQCAWDNEQQAVWRSKNFTPAFDLETLIFTFELDSLSPARRLGSSSYTQRYYPADRLGRLRSSTYPSAGCYESK